MPKLRRLSGLEVVKILEAFDFELIRVKGSHHIMQRIVVVDGGEEREERQTVSVPVHGRHELPLGTLRSVYRAACRYIPKEDLRTHFYAE
jgi:predicted RNA binding protein YcfA (HicA-like mRNA interferase family)